VARSVDMYNEWFMRFAPKAFRETRVEATADVEAAFALTRNLQAVTSATLREHPEVLPTLRMCTCPPLAVDRLIGLARVRPVLVKAMEGDKRLPPRLGEKEADEELEKLGQTIRAMADPDILVWLGRKEPASKEEVHRAATVVADRLCGAVANPIIRNAQEKRQIQVISDWLRGRGYRFEQAGSGVTLATMPPGSFAVHLNVPVRQGEGRRSRQVNIPADVAVKPKQSAREKTPLLIEAKSAGDYTNVNKRRKEEATKMAQLHRTYGRRVRFILFLCGYFDTPYLGYEAGEGIDWVWEHRIDDLARFGL